MTSLVWLPWFLYPLPTFLTHLHTCLLSPSPLPQDSEAERFNIEFSHDELFSFFQNIEKIQQQLDRLS